MSLAPDCIFKIFHLVFELVIKLDVIFSIIEISTQSKMRSFFLLIQFFLGELELLVEKYVLLSDLFLFVS